MTAAERRPPEEGFWPQRTPLGRRALRAYLWAYAVHAVGSTGRRADETLRAFGEVLTLCGFPEGEPEDSDQPDGYSQRLDALWLRPSRLIQENKNEWSVPVSTLLKLFYGNRNLVPRLQKFAGSEKAFHWRVAHLRVKEAFAEEGVGTYFRLAGEHGPVTVPWYGVVLVGHDPVVEEGLVLIGLSKCDDQARLPAADQFYLLKHGVNRAQWYVGRYDSWERERIRRHTTVDRRAFGKLPEIWLEVVFEELCRSTDTMRVRRVEGLLEIEGRLEEDWGPIRLFEYTPRISGLSPSYDHGSMVSDAYDKERFLEALDAAAAVSHASVVVLSDALEERVYQFVVGALRDRPDWAPPPIYLFGARQAIHSAPWWFEEFYEIMWIGGNEGRVPGVVRDLAARRRAGRKYETRGMLLGILRGAGTKWRMEWVKELFSELVMYYSEIPLGLFKCVMSLQEEANVRNELITWLAEIVRAEGVMPGPRLIEDADSRDVRLAPWTEEEWLRGTFGPSGGYQKLFEALTEKGYEAEAARCREAFTASHERFLQGIERRRQSEGSA